MEKLKELITEEATHLLEICIEEQDKKLLKMTVRELIDDAKDMIKQRIDTDF